MLWSRTLLIIFGSHRAFLRQIDPWMTFDPRWGRFENMPTNLLGPSPTPMPTFSSVPLSMTKRIAGHTYTHTNRLWYFSSIDFGGKLIYTSRLCWTRHPFLKTQKLVFEEWAYIVLNSMSIICPIWADWFLTIQMHKFDYNSMWHYKTYSPF